MNYNKNSNSIKRRYSKVIARKKRKKRIKKKRRTKWNLPLIDSIASIDSTD
jgi:hypothetical protein